jgi:hypothetical protein
MHQRQAQVAHAIRGHFSIIAGVQNGSSGAPAIAEAELRRALENDADDLAALLMLFTSTEKMRSGTTYDNHESVFFWIG